MSFAEDMGHDIPDYDSYEAPTFRRSDHNTKNKTRVLSGISLVYDTNKALLFEFNKKQYWVPKSQIVLSSDGKEIEIPEWLIDKLSPVEKK